MIEPENNETLPGNSVTELINKSFSTNKNESEVVQISKKKLPEMDTDFIFNIINKYKIEEINLSNLQKLQEREIINVPFFQKLRKLFTKNMIKSHLMETLGISKSYTGFHEYMKGEREDIPNAGLCNIAKKVGYNIMIIPIPDNITDAEYRALCTYRDAFIYAVEDRIKNSNIPVTRTKPGSKEKEKFVNTDLLGGLALDSNQILDSITKEIDLDDGVKISADEVFHDTSEPLETPEPEMVVTQMPLDFDTSLGKIEDLKQINTGIIMNGYDDSFSDFKNIGEEDFDFDEFTE